MGGVREKVLAAHRLGLKRVLLPRRNQPDLVDVPPEVREAITVICCESIDQVLRQALVKLPEAPLPRIKHNGQSQVVLSCPLIPYAPLNIRE